jgi:hypothetical protein
VTSVEKALSIDKIAMSLRNLTHYPLQKMALVKAYLWPPEFVYILVVHSKVIYVLG